MRILGIKYIKPGMKIGRAVYRADGRIILGKGVELSANYIEKLPEQGITSLYIQDDRLTDVEIEDVLSDNMRSLALKNVKEINDDLVDVYTKMKSNNIPPKLTRERLEKIHDRLNKLGKDIVEDFYRIKSPMVNLLDTRLNEDYIYAHMVNVAALSVLIGQGLGYNFNKLVDLVKGCLVHDIGILAGVPEEIRFKKGKLTEEELNIVKKHPIIAYKFLKQVPEINVLSAHVAYQHHERFSGNGYPRGLSKDKVNEYGYVAGLADVYDAITNNKVYKLRVLPEKAREFLEVAKDKFFPEYIVTKFLEKIPAYPIGTSVVLLNGMEGVVIKQNFDNFSRPVVRVLNDGTKELSDTFDIDLNKKRSIKIKKILD